MANTNLYKSVNNPNGYTFNLEIEKLTDKMSSPVTQSNLKFTYADRTNNSREEVNLFSSFRLPVNAASLNYFTSAFGSTAASYLNQDVIIFAPIPKDEYGEMLDGKTIKFEFPTTGGTRTLYGTYSQFSAASVGDAIVSDNEKRLANNNYQLGSLTNDPVSGEAINPPNVNGQYKSNVCLLFNDDIAIPAAGGSWATGWGTNNPYAVGLKEFYQFAENGTYDQPVGIAYLDSGFIVITDPTLTHDIDVAGMFNADGTPYVGGTTDFADIYYSATSANAYFESINSEYVLNVLCIADNGEFNDSTNPTYIAGTNNKVRISEVALYGDNGSGEPGELLAYGKLDRPVEKGNGDYLSFVVQIKA